MSKLEELIQQYCPNGVEYKTIGDVCDISRGKVMSKDYIRDNIGIYPVYSSQTENNGELGKISTYSYDGEYLTWTTDGANAGSVFYRNEKFSITNVCGLLKAKNDHINVRFLYYVLGVEAPKHVNKGMGNAKLMSNVMASISVPVPPLPVQEEIVRILDEYTDKNEQIKETLTTELTARKQQYEYYRDEMIQNCNNKLMLLKDLVKIKNGKDYKHLNKGDYPVYGSGGIMTFVDGFVYDKPTVLIPRKGSVDKLYYTESPFWNVDTIFYTEVNENVILPKYLFYLLEKEHLEQYNTAGGVPSLTQSVLNNIALLVPNLEEQQRIVNILDRFDALCNDISSGLPAEIEARQKQYEYYRDKLLTFKNINDN